MKTKLFLILFALLANVDFCLADDGNGLPIDIEPNTGLPTGPHRSPAYPVINDSYLTDIPLWDVEISNPITGQIIYRSSSKDCQTSISTIGWPKGTYIVKTTISNKMTTQKVVVK